MANHGYCKNCWWWNQTSKKSGTCVFSQNKADENSYCPDYYNRKNGDKEQTLEEFCKETDFEYIKYYELG